MYFWHLFTTSALLLFTSASPANVVADATKPSRTCSLALKATEPPQLHCGFHGSLRHPDVIRVFAAKALPSCLDACISATSQCVSFAYNAKTHQCQLLAKTLLGQGIINNASSPVIHYNRHCYRTVCSANTRTRTTSSIASPTCTPIPTCQPSNIINGDFETGAFAPWNITQYMESPSSGYSSNSSIISPGDASAYAAGYNVSAHTEPNTYTLIQQLSQTFGPLCPCVQYTLTYSYQQVAGTTDGNEGYLFVTIYDDSTNYVYSEVDMRAAGNDTLGNAPGEWHQVSVPFQSFVPANGLLLAVAGVGTTNGDIQVLVDNIFVS